MNAVFHFFLNFGTKNIFLVKYISKTIHLVQYLNLNLPLSEKTVKKTSNNQ